MWQTLVKLTLQYSLGVMAFAVLPLAFGLLGWLWVSARLPAQKKDRSKEDINELRLVWGIFALGALLLLWVAFVHFLQI